MQGEWLRLGPAAERLGISVDTLRRRIKREEISSRKVPTRQGYSYEVYLGDEELPDPRDAPSEGPTAQLLELVRELTQRNEELAAQLGHWRALAEDRQERLLLSAPSEPQPSPVSWWRRIFGR